MGIHRGASHSAISDLDRTILAKHEAGATLKAIADDLGVKPAKVRHVVTFTGPMDAKGVAMLAADLENIEGLMLTGAISRRVYGALADAPYQIDVPDLD